MHPALAHGTVGSRAYAWLWTVVLCLHKPTARPLANHPIVRRSTHPCIHVDGISRATETARDRRTLLHMASNIPRTRDRRGQEIPGLCPFLSRLLEESTATSKMLRMSYEWFWYVLQRELVVSC